MVVDTSAFLAVFFDEPRAAWASGQFDRYAGELLMSTVNLTEALIRVHDTSPQAGAEVRRLLDALRITLISPDEEQATIAAGARSRFGINLGDCFVYALARVEHCGIITVDQDFRRCDVTVLLP